jgi:hypothetical protein
LLSKIAIFAIRRAAFVTNTNARRRKPRTAWELCEQACKAIAENPLNYCQAMWKSRRGCDVDEFGRDSEGAGSELPPELDLPENTCGTAFCRAGWLVVLHDGKDANPVKWERRALELLGMNHVGKLFDGGEVEGAPGSPDYVKAGVSGLRAFMAEHEAHLKAHRLKDVS